MTGMANILYKQQIRRFSRPVGGHATLRSRAAFRDIFWVLFTESNGRRTEPRKTPERSANYRGALAPAPGCERARISRTLDREVGAMWARGVG